MQRGGLQIDSEYTKDQHDEVALDGVTCCIQIHLFYKVFQLPSSHSIGSQEVAVSVARASPFHIVKYVAITLTSACFNGQL